VVGVPDGANAGRHRAAEPAEPATTDATTDTTEDPQEQPPGTPEDQVNGEIARAEISDWLRDLFPFGDGATPHQAGGGGTGGQFMFASLEELDGIIAKWKEERDGIIADRDAILAAQDTVAPPAGDTMSVELTEASKSSLAAMKQHSEAMLKYANDYIAKLYASRVQMATQEEGARETMHSVSRDLDA
jgi:hypothetical protein